MERITSCNLQQCQPLIFLFSPDFFKEKLSEIPVQSPVAASVITFDPVAYQVKGTWQGIKSYLGINLASMHITEVYSACPPLPGVRIV